MVRRVAIMSFVVVALAASTAGAADKSREEAKVHFQKGTALYDKGQFDEALAEFRLGHEVLADPSFDYSIALCLWKLGNLEAAAQHATVAVSGFEAYGTAAADPAAKTQALIVALRGIGAASEVADDVAALPPVVVAVAPIDEPQQERKGLPAQTWVGGAMAVAGVGLLGWWGAMELSLGGKIDDYEAAAAASDAASWGRLREQIESKQKTARIVLFSGAGLTAVGGALLVWGLTASPKTEGATVHLSPTGATMVWKF